MNQSKQISLNSVIPALLTVALSLHPLPARAEDGIPTSGALFFDEDGRIFVEAVVPGSPADKAGLQVGDLITNIDGIPVHSVAAVTTKILGSSKSSTLQCSILRGAYDATPRYGISSNPGQLSGASLTIKLPITWLSDTQATKYNQAVRSFTANKIRMFNDGDSPVYLSPPLSLKFRQGSETFYSYWGYADLEKRASRYPILDSYTPLFQANRTRTHVAFGGLGFAGLCLVLAPFSGGGDLGSLIVGSMFAGLGVAGVAGVLHMAKAKEDSEAAFALVHAYNRSLWGEITASGSLESSRK